MKASDIERIEGELNVALPDVYKKAETMSWDDADRLIELNRELRTGRGAVEPWPARFFALGVDHGGCSDAIDLEDPEYGVFWFDRQHIQADAGARSAEKIEAWLLRQVREYTGELLDAGVDPGQSPEYRKAVQDRNAMGSCSTLVIVIVVLAVVLLIGIAIGVLVVG